MTEYRLVKIYDVRTWDAWNEEYYPLEEGQENVCERCHRKHLKVYVVEHIASGVCEHVGSGCCQTYLRWEPTKEEIKAANAADTKAKKAAHAQAIEEKAQKLIAQVLASVPGKRDQALRIDMAKYILSNWGMTETQNAKIFNLAKKAFK